MREFLTSWALRPEIIIVLLTFGTLYTRGWILLRKRGSRNFATIGKLVLYWSGLILIALVLMSGIDVLGGLLFFMHMIQHIITMGIVPILIWSANPVPFLLWGLPNGDKVGEALLGPQAKVRLFLEKFATPQVALGLYMVCLWGWHDPAAYQAALRNDFIHDLEHISFFVPAMLIWWHGLAARPRMHTRLLLWQRAAYLFVAGVINAIPGVFIALSSEVIYPYYEAVPRLWGFDALQDQTLAGIIMWIPGTMCFLFAAVIIFWRYFGGAEDPALKADFLGFSRELRS